MPRSALPIGDLEAPQSDRAGAAVKLLHVGPLPDNQCGRDGYLIAYADQEIARLEAQHLDYLATVEVRLANVPVECAVRMVLSSGAEQVFRKAAVPVVLYHADGRATRPRPVARRPRVRRERPRHRMESSFQVRDSAMLLRRHP